MNDIDYDGMFIDANGRYVIRLVYKEKTQAASAVWYRALINFGDLDKFIDFDLSYVLGKDGKTQYKFDPVSQFKGRGFDLGLAAGDRTNNRKNLPINLVLKEGVDLDKLGNANYIVQMRVANGDYTRIYAYAPKGTSMDYSTYTKTTAVDLADKLGTLFIKGGKQSDQKNATNQEFFMSEFIANPDQYPDKSNLGIIRTQYMGQTNPIVRETVGDEPIAYTQVFDKNLVNYLKTDTKGNVAYVNVLTNGRVKSPVAEEVAIPEGMINYSENGKLAYIVIGTKDFKKDGVKVVTVDNLEKHVMISGFYITAIDYVVDKAKFEDTFSSDKVRKLNYAMMSGWTNPNQNGWVIYEKDYDDDYVVPEGESYLIDTGDDPTGGQIMIQVGGDQAILRKPQGYYNGYVSGDGANDAIEKYANGVYKFTLREGATILKGKKLRVYMPYTSSHNTPVNFLEIHNGTKFNQGAAELKLENNKNIKMHLYKADKKESFKLKYTLKGGKEGEIVFTPKILWQYKDSDGVLTGVPNRATDGLGGTFYINTKKLEPGADIFVESIDADGNKIANQTSWFKYRPLNKSAENVKLLTWVDHSDKKSVLSINKSLYTPYQLLFTNDYAEGSAYQDPRKLPTNEVDFNKDTKEFVGYTKYDGGKVRTLYEEGTEGKLIAKVEADENDYDDKGNIKGTDVRKDIKIPKANIFDPHFDGENKQYKAYEYKVDLSKMKAYHSDDKTDHKLELLKDMKFVSTASDGSSLPSDLYETRVRARVLFDTTEGAWADSTKKAVKIVPDNDKFYGEKGYAANGFEGANVEIGTGDKFPDAPKAGENKTFLGWVTAEGKKALGKTTVSAEEFNKVDKKDIFRADTPVTKHLVVYAIYSEETSVTFDANGGKFADEKEQTTVKVTDGNVTAPTLKTRDGYTFKGWAATKDAKTADADILKNVDAPKTVYAVWEKTEKTPLELTAPIPVEVKDLNSLTTDEKDKVKDAVIAANSTLTKDDITVADDGTVTVTKDGKTGTLAPKQTVKQKEVQNNFNPPKEPVPVEKIGQLTNEEIGKIKQAVKEANPERNFTDEDITVEADGTVKINQGGKVGTIPSDKTVVQKDTILDLNKPAEKVEVKNPANLTPKEREDVAKKVKDANSSLTNPTVDVDSKGNVTVTVKDGEKTKTGKLEAKDTVKPFTRDGKTLNPPAQKVKVGDTNNLNEAEKQAVRDAVKAANPELDFKDDEIQVDSNGAVTVPMGDTKTGNIPANETVEEAKDTDNIIKLVAPTKTPVDDKNSLTDTEKKAVVAAVLANNDGLGLEAKDIVVANDGSVTVEKNGKIGRLSQKDTVEEKLKAPTINAAKDGSVTVKPADDQAKEVAVTYKDPQGNEKTVTATKGADGKWTLPKGTDKDITVDEITGEITLPSDKVKNGEEVKAVAKDVTRTSEEASTNAKDEIAPEAPKVDAKDDGSVEITPSADKDTKSVTIAYKDQAGNLQTLTATKGDDGNWTLPAGTDASIKIDQTTGVVTLPKDKIKAGEKVTAKAKDANENESVAGEATPVDKADLKAEVDKENTTKADVKYTNASQDKQEAYDSALDKAKKALNDPDAKQKDVNDALQQLKEAEAALDGTATPAEKTTAPTITKPNAGDKEIKGTAPAGSDVTVTLPDGTEIKTKADQDGKWTAKLPEGKEIAENDEIKVVAKDGDKEPSAEVKETAGPKASEEKPTAPDVKVKNNGDITVTPPADATKVTISYTDPYGNLVSVDITKGTDNNWNIPAGSVLTKDSDGNIVIPANNVKPGTEVTATAEYPGGTKATGRVNTDSNPQYPIYPGYNGYNGLPLWYFYGNIGSNNTKVEPKKEVKEVKERGHHEEYMYGYPDGTFRPNANITRAEAAAMISRLKGYSLNDKTAPEFKDSKVGWFKAAINAVFKNGLMKGYEDGNFRPDDKITRAEFAQMIKNIDKSNSAVATFKDVKGHWAEDAINQAFGNGRISGYPDGTFRPDAPITRAEAVKIANSLFERSVDNSGLKEKLENPTMISKFTDVNNTHWAFYEIMEATNNHEFERRENGKVVEDWLEIDKDKKH
ncbi:S-layer homology domain-containing protein [uncultured Peptoniphilus sp.]|uniref:S-layer homology domain-containing protein n=1 Tax=uncultured Peptoniphilus sp. TaxID=254354 RepID=UPI002804592E|nr:S-layer homology domain-containing protein [uncultured Peptoniphilus sp.]